MLKASSEREPALKDVGSAAAQALVAFALALVTFLAFAHRLDYVPPHLSHDEVIFSLQAHAIATTGRDVSGRLMPLFFQVNRVYWATPVSVYSTALLLTIAPLTETLVRIPNVFFGALSVGLVYLLALRVSRSRGQAILASGLLALAPAYLIHSRMGADLIEPIPFLLLGLIGVVEYFESGNRKVLFWASAAMGLGCYSYMGALSGMPMYFLTVLAAIVVFDDHPVRTGVTASAGFALPLLLLIPWMVWHPEQFSGQLDMYNLQDAQKPGFIGTVLQLVSYPSIEKRAELYYHFFDPVFLFKTGGPSMMNTTTRAGVLLTPLAVFLPVGTIDLIRNVRTPGGMLTVCGLFLAPITALVVPEVTIHRELIFLPFAAMIAAHGVFVMLRARFKLWAIVALALLLTIPSEFRSFYGDYMTEYRPRAAYWFDRNVGDALEDVIRRDPRDGTTQVYISRTPRWVDWYWRWYLAKAGRSDLLARTTYTVPGELDAATIPPGSIIFGEQEEVEKSAIFRAGARRVSRHADVDGKEWFVVFER